MSRNPQEIRAITVRQPWATLIAIGAKTIETRSWRTAWRGTLAIHAGSGFSRAERDLVGEEPFITALERFGYVASHDLPRGAIVALARLVACVPTDEPDEGGELERRLHSDEERYNPEREFGNYGPRRYAWLLAQVERVRPEISARGKLGFWTPPHIPSASRHLLDARSAA